MQLPVAVFGFNRPSLIARLLDRLRLTEPKRLYFFCDGPRNETDVENVKAVQKLFSQNFAWQPKVEIRFHTENRGLARSLSGGITEVFNVEEKLVILEDDILPETSFFSFCEEMLTRYNGHTLSHVTGHCPLINRLETYDFKDYPYSYYFSRYGMVWGWATWKESWQHFDFDPAKIIKVLDSENFRKLFPEARARELWSRDIRGLCERNDASMWALRWMVANWQQGKLTLVPTQNLCSHWDDSQSGVHVRSHDKRNLIPSTPLQNPLRHPPEIARHAALDSLTETRHFHLKFPDRLLNLLRRNLGPLFKDTP
jgi:hypothetical protein